MRADAMHSRPGRPGLVIAALGLAAAALSLHGLAAILPPARWWPALTGVAREVPALVFLDVALPRIAVSWILGAGLALAGTLLQQALRNPLADATTIGVSAGAWLALAACSLFAPALLAEGQTWVALAGGGAAAATALGLAGRAGFSPGMLIIAGLTISLLCGSGAAVLTILNHEFLSGLSLWQTGSLVQNGWGAAVTLASRIAICALAAALLLRPLVALDLGDAQARGIGIPVAAVRAAAVTLAIAIAAFAVSAVGVIGFVGVAAPNLARLLGARNLRRRLVSSAVLGAVLLWLTDQLAQHLPFGRQPIPTGSAAALMGSPLLLWLLLRRDGSRAVAGGGASRVPARPPPPGWVLAAAPLAFCFCVALALLCGRGPEGWYWLSAATAADILPWRWPRVAAAAAGGAMLAVAGSLLQRMTGNPLASPEVLGVSSGAVFGTALLLLLMPGFSQSWVLAAALLGTLAALGAITLLNWRSEFASERLLLTGLSLTTIASAVAAVLLTGGDPRAAILLTWMSGSTYRVSASDAALVLGVTAALLAALPFAARWLGILPLGGAASRALGVPLLPSRLAILLMAAVPTAIATLTIGPLSFAGLIAPHMARALGARRPLAQAYSAAAIGGAIMVTADWLGRTMAFPWQVPAGLAAALIGGPLFFWLIGKSR